MKFVLKKAEADQKARYYVENMKYFPALSLILLFAAAFSISAQQPIEEKTTSYAVAVQNSGGVESWLEPIINFSHSIVSSSCKNDEGMVLRFVGRDRIDIEQPFTSNKADLKDAIDNLYIEGGKPAIIDAVYLTIENISHFFQRAKKKPSNKVLILISNGIDSNSYYNEKQLTELVKESNVVVNVIGLVSDQSKNEQAKSRKFLERLSKESGGKAFFPTSPEDLANNGEPFISSQLKFQCK